MTTEPCTCPEPQGLLRHCRSAHYGPNVQSVPGSPPQKHKSCSSAPQRYCPAIRASDKGHAGYAEWRLSSADLLPAVPGHSPVHLRSRPGALADLIGTLADKQRNDTCSCEIAAA